MGHTAQADPNKPNNPRTDRLLSAARSAEVAAYITNKNIIDPSKLVGISYGQFRPVDTFETSEGRARNRRVEFLIVDAGADIKSMNDYYDEYYSRVDQGEEKIPSILRRTVLRPSMRGTWRERPAWFPNRTFHRTRLCKQQIRAQQQMCRHNKKVRRGGF